MLLRFFICSNARDAQQKTLFPQGLSSDKNNGELKSQVRLTLKLVFNEEQNGNKIISS